MLDPKLALALVSWLDFELVQGLVSEKVPVLDVGSVYRWDLALAYLSA